MSRCNEQGIGFELIVFDYAGDLNVEGTQFMDSLCRAVDGPFRTASWDHKISATRTYFVCTATALV